MNMKELYFRAKEEINPNIKYLKRLSDNVYQADAITPTRKKTQYIIQTHGSSIRLLFTKGLLESMKEEFQTN